MSGGSIFPYLLHYLWNKIIFQPTSWFHLLCLLSHCLSRINHWAEQSLSSSRDQTLQFFMQIRAQIFNSSERSNYKQTLQCASFKNSYLYQIQTNNFIKYMSQAYNFMIKRIPRTINIFIGKNKRWDVSLPISCIRHSLSRGHQTTTIINHEG